DLAPIRSGFRAKYIVSAATLVATKELSLQEIYTLPLPDARQSLMRISGVGPKVAECALLYGFHRTECFPMDVWMKRAMSTLLPHMVPEDFGKNAGIAQQYLFHYSRRNPQLFAEK
ncbi:MAG: DNA-3-methyladenine glycosylase 2 family protein, partial [Oscillospiraceae bacterium]